jgi:hypothetical protein
MTGELSQQATHWQAAGPDFLLSEENLMKKTLHDASTCDELQVPYKSSLLTGAGLQGYSIPCHVLGSPHAYVTRVTSYSKLPTKSL